MNKRILSLVLALVMVLGTFGTVFAAEFDDVTGSEFESAVERLDLLGILEGYPDGTFKPANTITRAEFAAVAVRAKGLADAANASKGLATGFTDVASDYWAAGFITTAGKLGVINGVGNGQFAPLAPVKYEEAVTMMVRALGYEAAAQTKGGYPYGYLIVANEIGLLDTVKGTQGQPATRGIVAQITDNALEVAKMIQVGFGSDAKWVVSGSKEHGTDAEAQYLLHDLGIEEIKDYVTNTFRTKSTVKADEIEIGNKKYDIAEGVDVDAVLGAGVTAWAKDDVVFSISIGFEKKVNGQKVVFDKEQVLYDAIVGSKTTEDVAFLYVENDKYEWANKATIFVNNEEIDEEDMKDYDGAYGRFILNEDDDVEFAYLFDIELANTGLVTEIDKTDLDYVNLHAFEDNLALDDAEEIYVFNKDLSAASLDDIEENTSVFYWIDGDDNYYIVALDEKVEGNLDAVRIRDKRVTVEGTNVKVVNSIFSANEEEFEVIADFTVIEDYVDEDVTLYYNLVGDTLALVTGADTVTSKVFGIATWITAARNPVLSVYTVDGKEVDYTFEDRDDVDKFAGNTNFENTLTGVYFEINKDGEIKDGSLVVERDNDDFVKADDKKYGTHSDVAGNLYITEDTVVLRAKNVGGKLKPSVIKYDNIINKAINDDAIVMTSKGRDLGLLIFTDPTFQAVDTTEYGIITSHPVVREGKYKAEIEVFGEGKDTYTIATNQINGQPDAFRLEAGDLIEFKLNDKGDVVDVIVRRDLSVSRNNNTHYEAVTSKSGNYIYTTGNSYRITTDTIFFNATSGGALGSASGFGSINKDDTILVLTNGEELKVVIRLTPFTGKGTGIVTPQPGDTGVVTLVTSTVGSEAIEVETNGKVVEYKLTGAARDLINQVIVGDEVKLTLTDGRLTGIEVVKSVLATAKASLTSDIATAQALHDAAAEGTDNGEYGAGTKATLQLAITAANTVVNNTTATAAQVNTAKSTLATAVTTFKATQVAAAGDATQLAADVVTAQALHDAATEGTDNGEYGAGTKATLQLAITAANTVATNVAPKATAAEIATAEATLATAVTTFKATQVAAAGDATQLAANVVTAQALHDAADEGITAGKYPIGTKAILQAAITAANGVATKVAPKATAAEIATATNELAAVVAAFEAGIIK